MVESNNAINNTVGASISGVTNTFTVTNPSNTVSSAARATITVGGATAADPSINFNVSGATDWEMGIDNNDSDKLKVSQGTALGTNDTWIMSVAGERTMPLQPCFLAVAGGAQDNVTGDNTTYTVKFTSVTYDQNSDFDGTSTFTAPVDGKYYFWSNIRLDGLVGAHSGSNFFIAVNGTPAITRNTGNPGTVRDTGNFYGLNNAGTLSLSANDTVTIGTTVSGGAKVVSIGNAPTETEFGGFLIC